MRVNATSIQAYDTLRLHRHSALIVVVKKIVSGNAHSELLLGEYFFGLLREVGLEMNASAILRMHLMRVDAVVDNSIILFLLQGRSQYFIPEKLPIENRLLLDIGITLEKGAFAWLNQHR